MGGWTDGLEAIAISQIPAVAIPNQASEITNYQNSSRSGRSFGWPRCCSSVKARCGDSPCVTPSGQPKSLAAPSAPIYEMTSMPATPMGYIFSPNHGVTWSAAEIAISPPGGDLPYGVVADDNWAHILAEPGNYVRRRVPPVFRAIRRVGQTVVLEWVGQGTLQRSGEPNGPWEDLPGAISPQTVTMDAAKRFFRITAP